MSVKEMMDLVDVPKLENLIRKFSDENFGEIDIYPHLNKWAKNKRFLFEAFGNKLTIEKDVIVSNSTINEKVDNFVCGLYGNYYQMILYRFLRLLDLEDIAKNEISKPMTFFGLKIGAGQKISRLFKKMLPASHVEAIEIEYSKLIQSTQKNGKIILSIDPIDYLTMSQNKSNWRSCHSLNGEYRTGTFSYMMDNASAIGFCTDKQEIIGNHSTFYNKIWRQVVFFDNDLMFALQSREYPNSNSNYKKTLTEIVKELVNSDIYNNCHFDDMRDYLEDVNDRYHYNDILRVNNYGVIVGNPCGLISVGVDEIRCIETFDELTRSDYLSNKNAYPEYYERDDEDEDEDEDEYEYEQEYELEEITI